MFENSGKEECRFRFVESFSLIPENFIVFLICFGYTRNK